jgi:DNA-binding response OmpR family regulator
MTVIQDKRVVLADTDTAVIRSIAQTLDSLSAVCELRDVSKLKADDVDPASTDILILDFVVEENSSMELLKALQAKDVARELPIFAVVPATTGSLPETVLECGAADFITELDTPTDALQKIKTVLGESTSKTTSSHIIDITPHKVPTISSSARVFFVEDDALLHNLLQSKFEQSGFTCEFSVDGKNTLERVKAFKPDVIVLDIMLPGVSGLDILSEVKESSETVNIPVLMFSNRDEQSDRHLAEERGAAGFYVKAMTDLSDLVKEVQRLAQ